MNEMWALTQKYNTLNRRRWKAGVTYQLRQHQERMIQLVLNYGHDYARTPQQQWSFPAALMFTLRSVKNQNVTVRFKDGVSSPTQLMNKNGQIQQDLNGYDNSDLTPISRELKQ